MRTRLLVGLSALIAVASFDLVGAQEVKKVLEILDSKPAVAKKTATAAKESEGGAPGAARDALENPPVFYMRDKGKVAGMPKLEALEVHTRYGKLRIPMEELRTIRFAARVDAELKGRVESLVQKLGSDDFDEREDAMEAIRGIGLPALPSLQQSVTTDNDELKNRAEILISELEELAGESEGEGSMRGVTGTADEIVTARMTVKGTVLASQFEIGSRYGTLRVNVSDLVGIHFRPLGDFSRKLEVTASYQPPGNWLDTKIEIQKGQKVKLEATGQTYVSNYNVTSGPAGTRRYSGNTFNNFPMLSLVGKIGKSGKPFLVGTAYNGRAKKSRGRLYLSVVAFQYNPGGTTGKYEVKINVSGGE